MKFSLKPLNGLILAGLLASVGVGAMAQGSPAASPANPTAPAKAAAPRGEHRHMGRHDPAKMQAFIAKRQAELKAKLKITPAQEGAWTTFTASMQPPAGFGMRKGPTPEQRAEFDKLTTPQRIDKMKEMRAQHTAERNAAMDKRGDATKALYAALSPEQQATFDGEMKKHRPHGGFRHHGGPGPEGQRMPGGPGPKG